MFLFTDLRKLSGRKPKKIGSANRKSAKCYICGKSAIYVGKFQICGFAICEDLFADHPPVLFVESVGPFLNKQSYIRQRFQHFFRPVLSYEAGLSGSCSEVTLENWISVSAHFHSTSF
jgi:hypothetical protein